MRRTLRHPLETLGALYELARLAFITRFRFSGDYWRWRLNTAFGRGYPASRIELARAILEYARWVHRQRRAD